MCQNVNVPIRNSRQPRSLITALKVSLSISSLLATTAVQFDTAFLFFSFSLPHLCGPSCQFFSLFPSGHKTDIWSAGDTRGFKNILWVVWRVSLSLESEHRASRAVSFFFCDIIPQDSVTPYDMVISNLYRIGLGGRRGWLSQAVAMVTSGPGIIIGPGIWFQEKERCFLKGFCGWIFGVGLNFSILMATFRAASFHLMVKKKFWDLETWFTNKTVLFFVYLCASKSTNAQVY